MSYGGDLIEKLEQETGQKWDSNDCDNRTMDTLYGTMARLLNKTSSSFNKRDDMAIGVLVRY